MIDSRTLLTDLKRLLRRMEADIRQQSDQGELKTELEDEWQKARDAGRTSSTFKEWRELEITQSAVHWILGCVFLRFVEDNGLVERPWLAAPGERMAFAHDRYETYFRSDPVHSDRDYIQHAFMEAAELPGLCDLFSERHNPLWRLPISGDGAHELLNFWREIDPDSGNLVRDFTDDSLETRFLGDLYQDLSEAAKKRYALLQTPVFVEEFILDRTLDPAIDEFGFRNVRLIDPACGSGHFLLGAFHRLHRLWAQKEPGLNPRVAAQNALNAVHGVDLNPFAVAIARFRLLVAALQAADVTTLTKAPDFRTNLACGDSLLHGRHFSHLGLDPAEAQRNPLLRHTFTEEDLPQLNRILGQQYHAVVGNPPYITPKDRALNQAYRSFYAACHMKYALSIPFIERFFDLALDGRRDKDMAGYMGMIVSNSFMKREFGKKLIEEVLPRLDLTHVIDTSGAYIPGHGTPTAILFGRNRAPIGDGVRAVLGIKGEPSPPDDPAKGAVWSAIIEQVDQPGSESDFVSTEEFSRKEFSKHPWSIGGGGAGQLVAVLESSTEGSLSGRVSSIGITSFTLEDDAYVLPQRVLERKKVETRLVRPMVVGDDVRDHALFTKFVAVFPYDDDFSPIRINSYQNAYRHLWSYRTNLSNSKMFGGSTKVESGLNWFEFGRLTDAKLRIPLSITFAFAATHNHFVLDRGGKVFNRSAPVIKLANGRSEDDHLALLGLLNSSLASFWMKQVFHNKGSTVDERGARQRTMPFEDFYEFTGTGLKKFPLVEPYPLDLAKKLDELAHAFGVQIPAVICASELPTEARLDTAREAAEDMRTQMVALQEELDWRCYKLYGLLDDELEHPEPPSLKLGERAFEIAMARQMEAGELETAWFSRHRSIPITELPSHWPADYREIVERRLTLIENNRFIALVEKPEYKRRWSFEPWEHLEKRALRDWLLNRLEDARYWDHNGLISTNRLADLVQADSDFMAVAELWAERPDFDPAEIVAELVAAEALPYLPVLRYTDSGLRKREDWERTWELQREEDRIDREVEEAFGRPPDLSEPQLAAQVVRAQRQRKQEEIADIPVPPKYKPKDFQQTNYWRLRGALDAPKERFVSYPNAERSVDGSLVVAWAGWNHLQQARALSEYYTLVRDNDGWPVERLTALLAGILDLVPWLKQWHNEIDPEFDLRLGDFFGDFVRNEAQSHGLSLEDVLHWTPAEQATGRRRRTTKRRNEAAE